MRHKTRNQPSAAAAILLILASGASAQIPNAPIGPVIRQLGGPLATSLSRGVMPFYVASPSGYVLGYVGPNGAYFPAAAQVNAAAPGANLQAPNGTVNYFAPFTGLAGQENQQAALEAAAVQGQTFNGNGTVAVNGNNIAITANGNLYGSTLIPRTSDTIDTKIDKDNRLVIHWSGEPRAVASIRFALLDKNRNLIKQQTVTRLPAEARLAITSKTSYYQVLINYVNGTTTSMVSPL